MKVISWKMMWTTRTTGFPNYPWVLHVKNPREFNYDIEIPCIVQWALLWYSAPSSLNNDLLNDGVILELYNRVTDMAIETSFKFPFTQMPRFLHMGHED